MLFSFAVRSNLRINFEASFNCWFTNQEFRVRKYFDVRTAKTKFPILFSAFNLKNS